MQDAITYQPYQPRSSGFLKGGGLRHYRRKLNRNELMVMADEILEADPKHWSEDPVYFPLAILQARQRREIYVSTGTPDPEIASGLFWRTHPNGRPWNRQFGKNTASFYHS